MVDLYGCHRMDDNEITREKNFKEVLLNELMKGLEFV